MTTEPISDERLAEIRAGLEGVTPGPWVHIPPRKDWEEDEDEDGGFISPGSIEGNDGNPVCLFGDAAGSGTLFENAADHAHLTRLDPQTVAALLSRLDKAEAGRDENFDDAKACAEAAKQQRLWKEAAEAKVADLSAALAVFQSYGCPVCNGDCAAANPPVMCCPMVTLPSAADEDEFDHDPGDCCPNCGGDGVIYMCQDEIGCVDPESGCDLCERTCDWCKPRRPLPPPPSES